MLRWFTLLWLLLSAPWVSAQGLVAVPGLSARVTDLTGTLTAEQRQRLSGISESIERQKGAQVAILMLPTVKPEEIEQFGIRVADAWRIGRSKTDDGVIIIVAKDDRRMRIEVGYGLEGAIPDATAKRIILEIMTPAFRRGDFAGGLTEAMTAIGQLIDGEALPAPDTGNSGNEPDAGNHFLWLFLVFAFSGVLRKLAGGIGSLLAAGVAGWLAWLIFSSWLVAGIVGVVAFLFSFARAGNGWHAGGCGGWSGGSHGSGGGWSGGGGGFGGGGASGSW